MALTFRELFDRGTMIELLNVQDAQQAAVAEDLGFEAVAVAGSLIANHLLASPDGWQSPEEIIHQVHTVREATDLAILVDLDDALGTPASVYRYVRLAESAGAGAILLEDVDCPNRFMWNESAGQWDYLWPRLRPMGAAADLLKVAREALRDPATLVIGRTDALVTAGWDEAMKRAHAYVDTGAIDAMFFPYLPDELHDIPKMSAELGVPIMNVSPTPSTPEQREALVKTGMRICVYHGLHNQQMYSGTVSAMAQAAAVLTGRPAPALPEMMKEWSALRAPEPIRRRVIGSLLGHAEQTLAFETVDDAARGGG